MIKKNNNLKFKFLNYNKGMTYVELIVVLSIFAILSSVVLFNYGSFQDTIDLKNLSNEVALDIVHAQNSSLSGVLPPSPAQQAKITYLWKPSYGVYFNTKANSYGADAKDFIYFADLNSDHAFDGLSCGTSGSECINKVSITKNNDSIVSLTAFYPSPIPPQTLDNVTISFARPDSGPTFIFNNGALLASGVSYVQIKIASSTLPASPSLVNVYISGRIEVL